MSDRLFQTVGAVKLKAFLDIVKFTNNVEQPRSGLGYGMVLYKSAYFDWLIDCWVNLQYLYVLH